MTNISVTVRETIDSLKSDNLIEETGLSITLDELGRCVELLDVLGQDFADASQKLVSLIEELESQREVGYTWGINSELFHHIITASYEELRDTLEEFCPRLSIDDESLSLLRKVMQRFRRVPLEPKEAEQTVAFLGRLFENTDDENLRGELSEMATLLQLRIGEETF